jgi:branched-chain amino acid transport system substrate-binding protein
MKVRRGMRSVAIACAVAVGALGLGVATASAQQIDPRVKNIKKVKTPTKCPTIQGFDGTTYTVGSIAPMTGASSGSGFFPNMIEGVKARFAAANDANELNGKKVQLAEQATFDDKGDAAQNLTGAQSLVEQQKVYAVLAFSGVGGTSAPYLNQKGIPVVGWQLGLDIYGKYPNFFGFQNANAENLAQNYNSRTAEAMKAAGAKKVALIGGNLGNSAVFIEQIADSIQRFHKKDMEVVYKSSDVPPGNTQWGSYVEEIKKSGADFVYVPLAGTDLFGFMSALKQAGVTAQTMSPSGYSPRVTGVSAFDGHIFGMEFKPFETTPVPEGMAAFKTAVAKYAPNAPVDQGLAIGWLTGNAFLEGLKAAGEKCATWQGFINNLRLEKGYSADGWFEPISFQEVFNKPIPCAYYVKLTGGQFVPQFNGAVCGTDVRNNKIVAPTASTAPATATPTTTVAR